MLAGSPSVYAQAGPTDGGPDTAEDSSFADSGIIVMARRKEEALEDVPQTVSVATGELLDKLQIEELGDIDKIVAGVQIEGANISMRGLTFSLTAASSPTVATYLNDVPVQSANLFTSIFDVGQIEVLRGPQGTLRGISSPSGALTLTSRRPDLTEAGGFLKLSQDNRHGSNYEAALNIPIIEDMLAIRLAGVVDRDVNPVRSLNNRRKPLSETIGKRLSVRFEPTSSLKLNFIYNLVDVEAIHYGDALFGNGSPGMPGNPFAPPGYNGPPIKPFDRRTVQAFSHVVDDHNEVITALAEWSFAGQKLSYVGSWQELGGPIKRAGDDGNSLLGFEFYESLYPNGGSQVDTQEIRLSSEDRIAGIFDYVVGFFHRKQNDTVSGSEGIANFLPGSFGAPGTIPNPAMRPNLRYGVELFIDFPVETEETSFFGNVTAHIGDKLEVSAGARRIDYKLDRTATIFTGDAFIGLAGLPAAACAGIGGTFGATYPGICDRPAPGQIAVQFPQKFKSKPWIWDASISYKLTPDLMIYGHAGSSWRQPFAGVGIAPGGSNPDLIAQLTPYLLGGPERSTSYEAGVKWSFLDNRAYIFADAFYQKFKGLIYPVGSVRYLSSDTATRTNPFHANVPAEVKGFDIEVGFNPTERWSLTANMSWSDGKISGEIPCTDGNFDGVPDGIVATAAEFIAQGRAVALCKSNAGTSSAPDWNVRAQSEYNLPLGGIGQGFLRGLAAYQPKNDNISQTYTTPAYFLLDLFLGIRAEDRSWEISAYGKNITNTRKIIDQSASDFDPPANAEAFFGGSGYRTLTLTPPREFGITARIAFGSR
jgi:iron complex outermembrane receptor protein